MFKCKIGAQFYLVFYLYLLSMSFIFIFYLYYFNIDSLATYYAMIPCISDIADWMKCNRLQLNSSKSEFIWCSSSRRLKYLDCNPFVIGADSVQPKNEVRDLGVVLDRDLTMTSHITGLVRTSFAIIGQLRSVSRSLTQDATRHLVQSLILSRIDYCNVAFTGLPQRSIIRLQAVINAAARLILRVKKFDHILTLMRDELQWLRIGERIKFKLSILVYKCLNNSAPPYLVDRSGCYQTTATGRGCGHQTRLMFSCQERRLKWAIGPFRSLVHVPGAVFLQLFGKPKPFLLSKSS